MTILFQFTTTVQYSSRFPLIVVPPECAGSVSEMPLRRLCPHSEPETHLQPRNSASAGSQRQVDFVADGSCSTPRPLTERCWGLNLDVCGDAQTGVAPAAAGRSTWRTTIIQHRRADRSVQGPLCPRFPWGIVCAFELIGQVRGCCVGERAAGSACDAVGWATFPRSRAVPWWP